jgi:lysophospholipase L1-like esterase
VADNLIDVPGVLCGAPWPGTAAVAYPRADPADFDRLPIDTWAMAGIPAGVRLELQLDGRTEALSIDYTTSTEDLGYRGPGAGTTFAIWSDDRPVVAAEAELGTHTVRLDLPEGLRRITVYLPEGMRPRLHAVSTDGGTASPPAAPTWVCYGDSIAEGWVATEPARSWPMVAARRFGLDVVNLGYAGAARGEIVSAGHVASLPADVISLSHGTNCWSRTPHSVAQIVADYHAFVDVVRAAHPATPIVVVSPVVRPDAEDTPNALGATLADIRLAIEDMVAERRSGDPQLTLVAGGPILVAGDLADGVHPGDVGHEKLAAAVGPEVARAAGVVEQVGP